MAIDAGLRDGLADLERRVHDATARLRELREVKRDLERQLHELTAELAAAGAAASAGSDDETVRRALEQARAAAAESHAAWGAERAAWQAERAEVRERLHALTERLEGLLRASGEVGADRLGDPG